MRFIIEGAQARTGKDIRITVEACTAAEAERRANANGIFVTSTRLVAMKTEPAVPAVLNYHGPQAGSPGYRLFSVRAVTIAAFFTPLAGTAILATNFCRLGRKAAAAWSIISGLLLTALLLGIAVAAPRDFQRPVFLILPFLILHKIAKSTLTDDIARHQRNGGELISNGTAAGIGTSIAALIAGAYVLINMVH